MLDVHETYELDATDLPYGLSVRSIAELDAPLLDHESGIVFETDERTIYRAPSCPIYVSDDPRDDLIGYAPDRTDAALLAEELEADETEVMLAWLHRCDVTAADVARWTVDSDAGFSPEAKAMRAEARRAWMLDQLRLRRIQLHRAFQAWYGVADYRSRTQTLWVEDTTQAKGVRPVEVSVAAWVRSRIAAKAGTTVGPFELRHELAGLASAHALMRRRLANRTARAGGRRA